uniref:TIR domain-containing protein n=1 Tax=Guillardia theta TaxID=55529 RepID=A0A7S4NFM5_GUITH
MFFLYAILVILFFGLIYPDENGSATPGSITFLILASNQRGNLSFYVSFLFQIIFIYVAIFSLRRARRVGRMLALRQVMPVKGFQLCLAMGRRAKSSGLMETLEAALREGGVNVWTSSSYVQNAEKRGRQIMHAVSRSCFQLIVLSPDLICSSSDCVHILEALRGPRSRSIFYLDRSADWLASIHGRTLEANHVDRMEEALRRLGFRVVSCPKLLLQLIDSLYLHPEEGSEEEALLTQWWASSPPAYSSFTLPTSLSYGICSSRTGSTVSLCGLQGHVNFSFSGKLFPPSHSLRNGWFYLAKSSISSSSSSSRSSPPLTRSDDVELTPAPLASSFSSQTQRTQVHFELGRMFGVSWLGLAVLLFEVCIGGFILLGPYCGDTFSSYSRIFGSQYGTCQLTGLGLSYQPPLFSPANFTAAEVVVGTCWATFQICCETCRSRAGCWGFTVEGARCVFTDGSSWSPPSDAGAPAEFPPPSYVCKGCLSGRLLTSNELFHVYPPYFSFLQIIALFLFLNAPAVLWRFLDCRLHHSSELLPLFLIAEEFRRMDLSLHVFTDSHGQALETLSPLVSFLESCGLRVAVASDLAHAAASPDFFVLFLTDSESAADYWKERHRFDSARHLLVVSSRALGSTPQLLDLEVLVVEEEVFLHRFNQNLIAKTAVYIHKRSLRAGIPT